MTREQVLARLYELADTEKVAYKEKKFGVVAQNALGVYLKDLKALAKEIGKNSPLALELFDSGIYEGRLFCSILYDKRDLTNDVLEKWVVTFDTWEICDSFCMGLVAKSPFAMPKIKEWATREAEFEKRAAFATLAAYCMADKKAENKVFEQFFPMIKSAAKDERNFVKKAVNWALRNIGKRNPDLRKSAIALCDELLAMQHKTATWIAKDALRELTKNTSRSMDYPRTIYRP